MIGTNPPRPQPVLDTKFRLCLVCLVDFLSDGKGNRVCKRCKDGAAWKSGIGGVRSCGGRVARRPGLG